MKLSEYPDSLAVCKALRAYRRGYIFSQVLIFIVKAATALFGALIFFQTVFALIPWTLLPVLWDASIGLFTLSIASAVVYKCFLFKPSLVSVARLIEKRAGISHPVISLALELMLDSALGSSDLKSRSMMFARDQLPRGSRLLCQLPSRVFIIMVAALFVTWISTTAFIKPGCVDYWKMPFSMGSKVQARIVPGSVSVPMHSSITLSCIPLAETFPSCRLMLVNLADNVRRDVTIRPDSAGRFWCKRDNIDASFSYAFTLGATSFLPETVRVIPPPMIYSLSISIRPPAYINAASSALAEGQGNFSVYAGSSVIFTLSATGALKSALLCSSNGDTIAFGLQGNVARGMMNIKNACAYSFKLVDTLGQKSDSLPLWYIDIITDMAPLVHFIKPGKNIELSPALKENLWIEAADDIGIEKLDLYWRRNLDPMDSLHKRNLFSEKKVEKLVRAGFSWDLSEASLYPGDTVFYWAFAKDNYPFDTLHHARTETYWFRLPSFEEIHERLTQEENSTGSALKSAQSKQEIMENTLSRLMQDSHGKQSLSWEDNQVLKDLKEGLQAQSDTLSKAVLSLKKIMESLKEQGFSGKELTDKMDKVRDALEDLAKEYGDSLLFNPPQNSDRVSMQDLKESLEKFKKLLPDLSKRLDNALKYLEMLKRDQKLAVMAMQAQKLGEQQARLASNSEKPKSSSIQEKDMLKKIEDLLSEISRSSDDSAGHELFPKSELSMLSQASKRAQSMKSGMSQGAMPKASEMDNMSADMFSLAQKLRDLQSTAMMTKMKKEKDMLMEMSHNALNMSQWQEQIASEAMQGNSRPITAQKQEALKQTLLKSIDALNSLSMTSPQTVSELMRQYDKAAEAMGKSLSELEKNSAASGPMASSEERLNAISFSLMNAAGAMDGEQGQGEGESGMAEGMQKLSGKQAMINGATGEILRRMLGGQEPGQGEGDGRQSGEGKNSALTEKVREQAEAAQKEIADELKQLADKYGKEAGSSMDKRAHDLEQEARKLTKMLENPMPEIRDHQDRFLSRMLESSVSMHKQDEGKEERKSASAKTVFFLDDNTPILPERFDRDSFYRMRQKAFMSNFPETYRFAIKNYFDSLGVLFLNDK